MARWIEVAKEADFSAHVQVAYFEGERIAVFKLEDGYYAINDVCSHDEASLSEGEIVKDCVVECPLHGATFDIKTGENLGFPAVVPVDTYPTRVENGMVYVQVEE